MNKIVLIMFFSERCTFCRSQISIIEQLKKSMGHKIEIINIDIDKDRVTANEWQIDATPTLILLKDNIILKKFVGLTYKNELISTIDNI